MDRLERVACELLTLDFVQHLLSAVQLDMDKYLVGFAFIDDETNPTTLTGLLCRSIYFLLHLVTARSPATSSSVLGSGTSVRPSRPAMTVPSRSPPAR